MLDHCLTVPKHGIARQVPKFGQAICCFKLLHSALECNVCVCVAQQKIAATECPGRHGLLECEMRAIANRLQVVKKPCMLTKRINPSCNVNKVSATAGVR